MCCHLQNLKPLGNALIDLSSISYTLNVNNSIDVYLILVALLTSHTIFKRGIHFSMKYEKDDIGSCAVADTSDIPITVP